MKLVCGRVAIVRATPVCAQTMPADRKSPPDNRK
jgi:hypothetical protein